jgi:phosphoribosyl 1,2-cyclic phosphate phosphodiesterase
MKITVLGCGASGGVPLITGNWGVCNPDNPKNRRRRASILIQINNKNILVDTGPDVREQLLAAHINRIDLILYTHAHADHIGGIEDIRQICLANSVRIPAYADSKTLARLYKSYEYVFKTLSPQYPAFLEGRMLENDFSFDGIDIMPFQQFHGQEISYGFRIGDFAYSTDVYDLPEESYNVLNGLDLWMVDCLRETPHPGHAHLTQTLAMIDRVKPRQAILTHMSHYIDYDTHARGLPAHVKLAYDGMILNPPDIIQ